MGIGIVKTVATSLAIALFAAACTQTQKRQARHFELYEGDSIFIERTVEVYDSFVRSRMGHELPLSEAYRRFFAESLAEMQTAGDMSVVTPDSAFVYKWTSDLLGGKMQNFLITPYYISPPEPADEPRRTQWPGGWRFAIDYQGIERLGNHVSETNDVWLDWTDHTLAAGDIWSTDALHMADRINFNNKQERFLAVIAFMRGCFEHRDFNMVKDARRNDSLKAVREMEIAREATAARIEMERIKNETNE